MKRSVFVHRAQLELGPDVDPRAPGGAVTTALCGHWEHEPPCRWPHNNSEPKGTGRIAFRTVFAAPPDEEIEFRQRIESALRAGSWTVLSTMPDEPTVAEATLGRRIAKST
jgi:hypothetical protein